ncbi:MAG: phosphonate C-P lyase system protein PhnH [Rhizobiaceae bacterium]
MRDNSALATGLADPVGDAQKIFRAVMDALARPGKISSLDVVLSPPAPFTATGGAVALALCDSDTPFWGDPSCQQPLVDWLRFQTGAPMAGGPGEATFALVTDGAAVLALDRFAQGTQDYPDRSTTVIVQLPSLTTGPRLRLTGPGIDGFDVIAPDGLSDDFVTQWADNRARFPRGVDVLLCAPEGIVGLPRGVAIEPEGS